MSEPCPCGGKLKQHSKRTEYDLLRTWRTVTTLLTCDACGAAEERVTTFKVDPPEEREEY